jgi:hypothetical protein
VAQAARVDGHSSRPHVVGMAARTDAKVTTDHEFIRDWVERRGGAPAASPRTRGAVVQIEYPGTSARQPLVPIGWDEFFDWFERNELAFQYRNGRASAKFIARATVMAPRPRRRAR